MERNRAWQVVGAGVIALAVVICCVLMSMFRLVEPVFFLNYKTPIDRRHYDDEGNLLLRNYEFEIQYVTNWDDRNGLVGVGFPGEPDLTAYVSDIQSDGSWDGNSMTFNRHVYGLYAVKHHQVSVRVEAANDRTIHLNQITMYLGDGRELAVDLGSIVLEPWPDSDANVLLIEKGGQFADGLWRDRYRAEETVVIQGVEFPGVEDLTKIDELVWISVNGMDYKKVAGMILPAGETLVLEYQFLPPQAGANHYDQYYLKPRLRFTTEAGEEITQGFGLLYHDPLYNEGYKFKDLVDWLKEREAL